MVSTRRMAAAATMGLLFGGCSGVFSYKLWHQSLYIKNVNCSTLHCDHFLSTFSIPINPHERFCYYAIRDEDSGQEVLDIPGFIACLCLLNKESRKLFLSDKYEHLPLHIRQCVEDIHKLMDVDNDKKIIYEEFCIFFTLLFAQRERLKVAFRVFDKNEDEKVSFNEFGHLLNALMIDPNVKIATIPFSSLSEKNDVISVEKINKNKNNFNSSAEMTKSKEIFTTHKFLSSSLAKRLFGQDGEKSLLFNELYTLLYNIRQEVWALQFGLCDPQNTGFISLEDCRKIIFCNLNISTDYLTHKVCDNCAYSYFKKNKNNNDDDDEKDKYIKKWKEKEEKERKGKKGKGKEELTSWDTFLKALDVIFEYDVVSHVMNLALKAKSPEEIIYYMNKSQKEQLEVEKEEYNFSLLNTNECELDSEEFYNVLRSCQGHFPHITKDDLEKIVHIFDIDGSGKMSPCEFAQMCRRRALYFSPRQELFNKSNRSALQHFFFCMQQL